MDEATKLLERYRIVRMDAGPLQAWNWVMNANAEEVISVAQCRHILACIKEARVRRNLLKEGGIGTKWNTGK